MVPAEHYVVFPSTWDMKHVKKGIFDGQKPDGRNLSDLANRTG